MDRDKENATLKYAGYEVLEDSRIVKFMEKIKRSSVSLREQFMHKKHTTWHILLITILVSILISSCGGGQSKKIINALDAFGEAEENFHKSMQVQPDTDGFDTFDDLALWILVTEEQGMNQRTYMDLVDTRKISNLANSVAEAALEAEVVLGGYKPKSDILTPYNKVLGCIEARSKYYNYLYKLFDNVNAIVASPKIDGDECDRYDSYLSLLVEGL